MLLDLYMCWMVLEWLVINLAKVIAMDAFAEFCTFEYLNSVCKKVCMIINTWKPTANKAPIDIYYNKLDRFYAEIMSAAEQAKTAPFVMVSTSKKQANIIHRQCAADLDSCVIGVIIVLNDLGEDLKISA